MIECVRFNYRKSQVRVIKYFAIVIHYKRISICAELWRHGNAQENI